MITIVKVNIRPQKKMDKKLDIHGIHLVISYKC